jgi:hypothetical protein
MTAHRAKQMALFPTPAGNPSGQPLEDLVGSRRVATAVEVLIEVGHGRYGILDASDQAVAFVEENHIRHALDVEDILTLLINNGYAALARTGAAITATHGAIQRTVRPVSLTVHGILAIRRSLAP